MSLYSRLRGFALACLFAVPLSLPISIQAADHRDAPAVDGAGEGDITDVFAFVDPGDSSRVVIAMGVNPFAVAALPQTYRFSTEYLYQFKVDVDGDAREDFVVQATFRDTATGQNVIVRVGQPDANAVGAVNRLFTGDSVEGAVGTVHDANPGIRIFAGLREDPFVFDVAQFFRILNNTQDVFRNLPNTPVGALRGRTVGANGISGIDTFSGFNASYIVVSIPKVWISGPKSIVNIWGTVSAPLSENGTYVQFERMGQPAFNTVFIPSSLKDSFNAGVPADDTALWSKYVPDALTTTDNDGTGNTIAGRATVLTNLGLASTPNGAPLLLPSTFANTNRDLLRVALLPDVLRLDLNRPTGDQAIGQFGLTNGRRPADDVIDIAFRVLRQLADVNFPASLNIPGSGPARAGALNFPTDRRVQVVLQGSQFVKPDAMIGDLTVAGNDKPFLTQFPYFAPPFSRPGDEDTTTTP